MTRSENTAQTVTLAYQINFLLWHPAIHSDNDWDAAVEHLTEVLAILRENHIDLPIGQRLVREVGSLAAVTYGQIQSSDRLHGPEHRAAALARLAAPSRRA